MRLSPRVGAVLAALLFALGAAPHLRAQAPEYRALYVPTFSTNTQTASDQVINAVLGSNINAVFVQVRSRGDAYYYPNRTDTTYPNPEPRAQLYNVSPADLDTLQYYIDRLSNASPPREVHAWLTTYNTWNRVTPPDSLDHVLLAHPEWITENDAGVTFTSANDAPLDPGIPAVQDFLFNVFMDVVRNYDIDGIHFDYIRLLGSNSGYDPVAKAQFLAETGWNYDTQNAAGQLDEVYEAWRRDQIAQLVQRVHEQTMLEKPWVETSAFLVNFSDSVEVLGQGYNWWVAHEAIDLLSPGCYSSSIAGTVGDWDFYMAKLDQNGDALKRPAIAAIGSYLFVDDGAPQRSAEAVNTLRANARPPDGYNFFAYAAIFPGGSAASLFGPGGPMATYVDVPLLPHKAAMGDERTPPNPGANLAVALQSGTPRVTFQRPAPAADGDLPVRYRLYRAGTPSIPRYYDNLAMEWWDPTSERTDFEFLDLAAPGGTTYYALVATDDWNNRAEATAGPVTVVGGGTYIVETRAAGLNFGDYSESGSFSDSSSHSEAPGLTAAIGSRFALPGDANGRDDQARFAPSGLAAGTYDAQVTCFRFASANANGITVRINDGGGLRTSTFDLTNATCGDAWVSVGSFAWTPGQGHYIEFDNTTQTNIGDATNSRMNAAAMRFVTATMPVPREPKPPAPTAPPSFDTELIVDTTPQALDYDDFGGAGAWATSTLAGYFDGNSRFYTSSNTFPMDNFAVWLVDLPRPGRWAIDGWVRHNVAFAQGALYRFVDSDGTVRDAVASQRSTFDDTTSGDWLIDVDGVDDADAYAFDAGRVYITIYGNTAGAQTVIADALRFRYLGPAVTDVTAWHLY